jgi:hypothetical protein
MTQVRELAPSRGQSEFVAAALSYYISAHERRALRERLVNGYQAYATEDIALAAEWREVDDEAWLASDPVDFVEGDADGPADTTW